MNIMTEIIRYPGAVRDGNDLHRRFKWRQLYAFDGSPIRSKHFVSSLFRLMDRGIVDSTGEPNLCFAMRNG